MEHCPVNRLKRVGDMNLLAGVLFFKLAEFASSVELTSCCKKARDCVSLLMILAQPAAAIENDRNHKPAPNQ